MRGLERLEYRGYDSAGGCRRRSLRNGGGIREAVGRRSKGRREKWEAVGKGRGVWGEGRRRGGRVILGDEVFCGKL